MGYNQAMNIMNRNDVVSEIVLVNTTYEDIRCEGCSGECTHDYDCNCDDCGIDRSY